MPTAGHDELAIVEETVLVSVQALQGADSPRLEGESFEHVMALAEAEGELPPILVHRETMRVIDGMHRLRAAVLNGRTEIRVRYFSGTDADVFVAAVRANVQHGLPLSLSDREAAAARILSTHAHYSDRTIAEAAGLASTTVARIRECTLGGESQATMRLGKDGRLRPVNSASGRRTAGHLLAENPALSLRDVADRAGISPATAKDVRERLARGEDPVPARLAMAEKRSVGEPRVPASRSAERSRQMQQDATLVLAKLQRDPSLRLSDSGRGLLRWLSSRSVNSKDWQDLEEGIPAHCVSLVAELAMGFADEWVRVAEMLRERERGGIDAAG
jgi:ParB-like chromosome segregation protein Spo0J